ncbi:MAG: hypothetical protein CL666_05050 [Balneola sp.]|nr:hypothetical protein [Balneola sp.]|tara:strand:+ start:75130 stop:76269 length:1140 start_codon:yes stop_codon:yes gene_type:complete
MYKLLLSVLLVSVPELLLSQEENSSINIINTYTDQNKEYLFGIILGVGVDQQENIYAFDYDQNAVLKLDKEGNYLGKVIRSGRGPAEIHSMYSYLVDDEAKRIYLTDRRNAKYLVTDLQGNEIDHHFIKTGYMNPAMGMERYDENTLALLFTVSKSQLMRQEEGIDSLIHFYDRDSFERTFSLADREYFSTLAEYKTEAQGLLNETFVGSITFKDSRTLLISPHVYNKRIIVYEKGENEEWSFSKTMEGKEWDTEAFIEVDFEDYRNNKSKYRSEGLNIASASGMDGNGAGIIKLWSAGIYTLESGEIVNFIVQEENFRHKLVVERYDEYLNHISSSTIFEGKKGELIMGVPDMDQQENFYMLSHFSKQSSRIVKFSLD